MTTISLDFDSLSPEMAEHVRQYVEAAVAQTYRHHPAVALHGARVE